MGDSHIQLPSLSLSTQIPIYENIPSHYNGTSALALRIYICVFIYTYVHVHMYIKPLFNYALELLCDGYFILYVIPTCACFPVSISYLLNQPLWGQCHIMRTEHSAPAVGTSRSGSHSFVFVDLFRSSSSSRPQMEPSKSHCLPTPWRHMPVQAEWNIRNYWALAKPPAWQNWLWTSKCFGARCKANRQSSTVRASLTTGEREGLRRESPNWLGWLPWPPPNHLNASRYNILVYFYNFLKL